jgi:hypothetical protein
MCQTMVVRYARLNTNDAKAGTPGPIIILTEHAWQQTRNVVSSIAGITIMNNSFFPPQHLSAPSSSSSSATSSRNNSYCPGLFQGYASSHLDTLPKILNHVLYFAVFSQVCLLFAAFSASRYLDKELMGGFSPVLCTCFLLAVTILVYVINNHHWFSSNACINLLEPTEFTIGLAAGLTIGTLVVAILMAQTFQTGGVLCDNETHAAAGGGGGDRGGTTRNHAGTMATTSNSTVPNNGGSNGINTAALIDPVLYDACANHRINMSSISFWSGLCAWLSAVIAILLTVGKNDILMARHYERIAESNNIDSFEEIYRRQQREILGVQQASALQSRAAAMFVGDYSSVPEVTQGNGTTAALR